MDDPRSEMSVRRDSLLPQLLLYRYFEKWEACNTSSGCYHTKASTFFSVSCKAGVKSTVKITRSETGLNANAL